ncbi:hypothetical protein AAP_01628 [Ascosphaera apis ARSEF 7405]|uniref:Uncharacterized protein n=1 Tax=Ascosphaera apis ARSEF 7405 TaxID=392613 RepID=A0A166P8Y1_9EURO|nr:hypothetical protein AAP_01628 [Ascosphaera apis ARSEF 7405]
MADQTPNTREGYREPSSPPSDSEDEYQNEGQPGPAPALEPQNNEPPANPPSGDAPHDKTAALFNAAPLV